MSQWMERREDIPKGWIYLGDKTERYILGQAGKRTILVFGVNPSTATPGDNNIDPTIRKVRKLAAEDGYDGWIMVNLYPLRATDPRELPKKEDKKLIGKNTMVLKALVKSYRIEAIWAAWGNTIDTRSYLRGALYDILDGTGDFQWFSRGIMTKKGNPRHPLYMKSGEKFERFGVGDYAAHCRYTEGIL